MIDPFISVTTYPTFPILLRLIASVVVIALLFSFKFISGVQGDFWLIFVIVIIGYTLSF